MAAAHTVLLDGSWKWKQRDINVDSVLDELKLPITTHIETGQHLNSNRDFRKQWLPATSFPSEVHVELLEIGAIPDPFIGFNEHKIQWIGETEWLYRTSFPSPHNISAQTHVVLEFEGLDTVCDAYLNGIKILETDNQFQSHSILVLPATLSKENSLLLHFKSASALALQREKEFGRVRAGSYNLGHPSRVYVRKAQYDWRWDWGPEIMTCGPYRPISLTSYTARIVRANTRAAVTPAPSLSASLTIGVEFAGTLDTAETLLVTLREWDYGKDNRHVRTLRSETVPILQSLKDADRETGKEIEILTWSFDEDEVQLWWPVGYGKQNIYVVDLTLATHEGIVLSTMSQRTGFRSVVHVQEPITEADEYGKGTSFLFEINGVRMFIGSNWIPASNYLTTVTDAQYRAWLELARDGGQNMIRLWGGGVYEPDIFYDICDELGLLVWQDFQFACGVYPAHDSFVASVKIEAEQNVKRIRRHPALTLWCGNNEDYQQILQWGGITDLPARKIYEHVLPSVVSALCPDVPYWRGSPYGGQGWDTADQTIGDVHVWSIWADLRPWEDYVNLGGRFVSEFGIASIPDLRTVEYWMQDLTAEEKQTQWYAQSKIMTQHCKAGSHERRFAVLMNEMWRITDDFETHVFHTQILQSEAISYAYRVWKRKWGGKGKEYTSGVLVWQLNDCWPTTSWSLADSFLRPKPVYYTIARALNQITVGILRTVKKNRPNDRPVQYYEFGAYQSSEATVDVWATNNTLSAVSVTLEIQCADLVSAWTHHEIHTDITLLPNQATELLSTKTVPRPSTPTSGAGHTVVVAARLLDTQSGAILARSADWPMPFKFVEFPDPQLDIVVDGERVTIEAKRPVKALVFSTHDEGKAVQEVKWSDNALDIMPGDTQVVIAQGLKGRKVRMAYVGKEHATFV